MKVIKSMKKLKFWSRKKKKKKIIFAENPPPNWHCCCQSHQFQPSAPPLPPPWLGYEQTHVVNLTAEVSYHTFSSEAQFAFLAPQENEIAPEMNPLVPALPVSTCSYQQYLVSNPDFGMPVVPPPRRERSAGVFGCVFNIGAHLIRCFFPCFCIQETY